MTYRLRIDVAARQPAGHLCRRNSPIYEGVRGSQQERPGTAGRIDDQLRDATEVIERKVDQRAGELGRGRVRSQRTTVRR